jgi:hypothetical protein
MNPPRLTSDAHTSPLAGANLLEQRLAAQIVVRLNEGCEQLEGDIAERLRFAREQALARAAERAKAVSSAAAPVVMGRSLAMNAGGRDDDSSLWLKLASVIPLLILIAGLFLIERHFQNEQISAAAEIDAALLADDLPPDAYSDPGFAEFLKMPRD